MGHIEACIYNSFIERATSISFQDYNWSTQLRNKQESVDDKHLWKK